MGYASRLGVPCLFADPPCKAASLRALRAASLRAQVKSGCSGCGKITRRANHQKSVQPPLQKYFCFFEDTNQCISVAIPSHTEGRLAIVTNAGRDAVDADAPITNGADADG